MPRTFEPFPGGLRYTEAEVVFSTDPILNSDHLRGHYLAQGGSLVPSVLRMTDPDVTYVIEVDPNSPNITTCLGDPVPVVITNSRSGACVRLDKHAVLPPEGRKVSDLQLEMTLLAEAADFEEFTNALRQRHLLCEKRHRIPNSGSKRIKRYYNKGRRGHRITSEYVLIPTTTTENSFLAIMPSGQVHRIIAENDQEFRTQLNSHLTLDAQRCGATEPNTIRMLTPDIIVSILERREDPDFEPLIEILTPLLPEWTSVEP